ncbi:MAG: hypothetical protein GQ574_19065, partial [Crocinitomix sp.]|nr:hypothetical protein [Crocinitomix sp.]
MTVSEVIAELRKNKIHLRIEEGNLKLSGDVKNLPKSLLVEIKSNKTEILNFLEQKEAVPENEVILAIERTRKYPLSNAQKRIWVLAQFEGGNVAYNIASQMHLRGVLIAENLEEAFRLAIKRHESLRTSFRIDNGEPYQFINNDLEFEIEQADYSGDKNIKEKLKQEVLELNNMNLDLVNGPLMAVKLVRISEDQWALLFVIHHIISDGWSIAVLIQEVMANYKRICLESNTNSEELSIQYLDFSNWLQQRINGKFGIAARKYWSQKNLGEVAPINLPVDFERSAINSFEGSRKKFYFDSEFHSRLDQFARKNQTTVFNLYRAVLSCYFHKISTASKLILGTPAAGRSHVQLGDQIGLYVNTIPLVSNYNPTQTFQEYLQLISADSLESLRFQDYPLDLVLEAENITRDPARNPLFDVLIVVQNTAIGDGSMDLKNQHGFIMEELDAFLSDSVQTEKDGVASKFDLTFNFAVEPDSKYFLEIEYKTKLFKKESILQLFETFLSLLEEVMKNDQVLMQDISIVPALEKEQLLFEFNRPFEALSQAQSISGLLKDSFERNANQMALLVDDRSITYKELDEQ